MELTDGEIEAVAAITAYSTMFNFMLAALEIALKSERKAGYTEDGRHLEPMAHGLRPALERHLAEHSSVGSDGELTKKQADSVNAAYQRHLQDLRQRVLDVSYPHEI